MARKPTPIDAYLATVKGERRAALEKLRKTILAVVPKAEECISYRMPAFRLVEGYDRTRGSLHFDPAKPLSAALVRKLVKARMAER